MSEYYQGQHPLPPLQPQKPIKRLPLQRTFYSIGILSTVVFATAAFFYGPMMDAMKAAKPYRDQEFQDVRELAIKELQRQDTRQARNKIAFHEAQLAAHVNAKMDFETYNAMMARVGKWRDADAFAKVTGRSRPNAWDDAVVKSEDVFTDRSNETLRS